MLFVVTEDWYFVSHRLDLARAARDNGFKVSIATRLSNHGPQLRAEGFEVLPLAIERGFKRPWLDIIALFKLLHLYIVKRPDIVHHVALKPVVVGTLAARLSARKGIVNAINGLGSTFVDATDSVAASSQHEGASGDGSRRRWLRRFTHFPLQGALASHNATFLVQNKEDAAFLRSRGVADAAIVDVPGAGVDTQAFTPSPWPTGVPVVTMVSRMLWDKGVAEVVEAARLLTARGLKFTLRLVGDPDPDNVAAVPKAKLQRWHDEGVVEWLGTRKDINAIWAASHVAVLPSYREGLPKALLEAAACGRPMVAADTPGCRRIVRHGETGLLVPPRDGAALANAIAALIEDPALAQRMGAQARMDTIEYYTSARVIEKTLGVYQRILSF